MGPVGYDIRMQCPRSDAHFNGPEWESISSDSVKCPLCGWTTHWANRREHTSEDAAIQRQHQKIILAELEAEYAMPT